MGLVERAIELSTIGGRRGSWGGDGRTDQRVRPFRSPYWYGYVCERVTSTLLWVENGVSGASANV